MGNRAVITDKNKKTAVYLHWNGGRDSVEAFLKFCELKRYRTDDYGMARLAMVIGNAIGADDGLSVGVGSCKSYTGVADGDNGVYIIDDWKIVGRDRLCEGFLEQSGYDLVKMLTWIDSMQGSEGRLPADPQHMLDGSYETWLDEFAAAEHAAGHEPPEFRVAWPGEYPEWVRADHPSVREAIHSLYWDYKFGRRVATV